MCSKKRRCPSSMSKKDREAYFQAKSEETGIPIEQYIKDFNKKSKKHSKVTKAGMNENTASNVPYTFSNEHPENLPHNSEDEEEFWQDVRSASPTLIYNGKEFAMQPDDENSSPIFCTSCYKYLSKDSSYFKDKSTSSCENCGSSLKSMFDTQTGLQRSNLKYLDDDEVRKETWYHTTQRDNWAASLNEEDREFVHLGTENAAMERTGKTLSGDDTKPIYVYELELDPDTNIHSELHWEDPYQSKTPNLQSDKEKLKKIDFEGATRYINDMEDRGSISLLVNPRKLRVKSMRVIEPTASTV